MISYYYAITRKNIPPEKESVEANHVFQNDIYKNDGRCQDCKGKWKPQRTHHCRQCGNCSLRMDHHCPWAVNCVGSRNHKAFYLFCCYMGVKLINDN